MTGLSVELVDARLGRHQYPEREDYGRHRHRRAYAAVIVRGGCEEAGDTGRHWAQPGDVLLHGAFDAHCNRFGPSETEILHLPLPHAAATGAARVRDVDEIARLAETDMRAASERLVDLVEPAPERLHDWPDMLAAAIRRDPGLKLSRWAEQAGLARETLSRGFGLAYGVTPIRFRAEVRARQAWVALIGTEEPPSAIAADLGFCDQAHMTRLVTGLTGRPPSWWRRWSHASKTEPVHRLDNP